MRSFVKTCISDGHNAYGIKSGIDGLVRGELMKTSWQDVDGWVSQGGAFLGTKRTLPNPGNFKEIAEQFKKFNIQVSFFKS